MMKNTFLIEDKEKLPLYTWFSSICYCTAIKYRADLIYFFPPADTNVFRDKICDR